MRAVKRNPNIKKIILIPGSKSYANRALIRASVKKYICTIQNVPQARDTLNLIQCLKNIGLKIQKRDGQLEVINSFPECEIPSPKPIKLDTGDGGTTNRFLIPLLAMGKNEYHLYPKGKIMERPMDDFQKYLDSFEKRSHYFKIQGPWQKQTVQVNCSVTTQIASAFMLTNNSTQILNQDQMAFAPYLTMTQNVIQNFDHTYFINADWSSAAFPLVFATLTGSVQMTNLKKIDCNQADSSILKVLEQVGVKYHFSNTGLTVQKHLKRPFQWNCKHTPDIFPALAFLASYLEGESTLCGLDNLKYKESNRLRECIQLLKTFGVSYRIKQNCLIIKGCKPHQKVEHITTAQDHRLIMTAYLFLRLNGGGKLNHASEVEKSFPEFFDTME